MLCGECEAVLVAAEVVALVLLPQVVVPVVVVVVVGVMTRSHKMAWAPSVLHRAPVMPMRSFEVAAGAFDDAGGDGPAAPC